MLVITKDQLAPLAKPVDAAFHAKLIEVLTEEFEPARKMPPGELEGLVTRMVRQARGFELKTEAEVAVYAVAAFSLGEDMVDKFPSAQRVLTDAGLTGKQKADWLQQWTGLLFEALKQEKK